MGKKQVKEINVPSRPSAGGHMSKPDHEQDALGEELKANYTEQTEFEAKEVPGACKKAVDKQTKTDGVDDTIRTPSNTPGCNK